MSTVWLNVSLLFLVLFKRNMFGNWLQALLGSAVLNLEVLWWKRLGTTLAALAIEHVRAWVKTIAWQWKLHMKLSWGNFTHKASKSKKTAQQKYAKMPSLVYCTVDQPKSLGRNDRSMLIFPMLKHAETTAEPAKEFLNYSWAKMLRQWLVCAHVWGSLC